MVAPASAGSSASLTGVPEVAVSALVAPSPALDHELRLHEERVGSTPSPTSEQPAHDQLERAQAADSGPVAALHEERVHCETSIAAALIAWISRFGATPTLASVYGAGVNTACSMSISPAALSLIGWSVRSSSVLTWSGVSRGRACSISATAPLTTGAAIDVPPALKYWPAITQAGHSVANALPGARTETMCAPGAITCGLAKPSWVVPPDDHGAFSPLP